MHNVISRFGPLRSSRLLFTGTDETLSLLPMVEALIASGIPGTFLCCGQQIPDDLKQINADELAQLTLMSSAFPTMPPAMPPGASSRYAAAA